MPRTKISDHSVLESRFEPLPAGTGGVTDKCRRTRFAWSLCNGVWFE